MRAGLFASITTGLQAPAILVADAYHASRKIILPLLSQGHHLVTRTRSNSVVSQKPRKPKHPPRCRRRIYAAKIRPRELWDYPRRFRSAPSPVFQDKGVKLAYYRWIESGDQLAELYAS